MRNKNLVVGTVQFGMPYGVLGDSTLLTFEEVEQIISACGENKIYFLDTAKSYGVSEARLGEIGLNQFKMITKISLPPTISEFKVADYLTSSVADSLAKMKTSSCHGVLIHNVESLSWAKARAAIGALNEIKLSGKAAKIGVSIYDVRSIEHMTEIYSLLDIVQAPSSLLDRRLENSSVISELFSKGVEIHARSIFLQGLLLSSEKTMPRRLKSESWNWREWLKVADTSTSRLKKCIDYVKKVPNISHVVFGVNTPAQLQQIVTAFDDEIDFSDDLSFMKCGSPRIIDPRLW